MTEREQAVAYAHKVLNIPYRDPDDDESILARQFLRSLEKTNPQQCAQTGRTTRMLEHAKRLASEGRAVYVVVANQHHRQALSLKLGPEGMFNPAYPRGAFVKVETPESLGTLDWGTLTLRGAHPNCVVLVDHYTIESRFGTILQELHRYDKE